MNIADVFVIPSMLLAQEVRQQIETNDTDENMKSFFNDAENDSMGDPLGSGIEVGDDECGENGDNEYQNCC
eukprot:12458597-Ditylum_brightwellii.AAC.1